MHRPPPTPMLQAFVAAAKTNSFARAAVELHITASAISHQVIKLEEWWGIPLFERHSRGVKLTDEGKLLFPVIDAFFQTLDATLHDIDPNHAPPLNLSCTSSLCSAWLSPRIFDDDIKQQLPNVILKSEEVTKLNIGFFQFDLAIVIGDGDFPGYDVEFLMRDMVFPVFASRLTEGQGKITALDVKNYPLIHRADDHICPTWDDWFEFNNLGDVPEHVGAKFPDSSLALHLAEMGSGIALGRTALVLEQMLAKALEPISFGAMPSPSSYYLICKKNRLKEVAVRKLHNWIKKEVALFIRKASIAFPDLSYKGIQK